MAIARATYAFPDQCSISVSVQAEASYPDSIAEVTTRCRQLLREAVADWNAQAAEDERAGA